ncbi:MAG: hypothetical protein R3E01_35110 [Pirellulaceae bacterium]|nr:hypothetical protein [Planctomycetales bacterium]
MAQPVVRTGTRLALIPASSMQLLHAIFAAAAIILVTTLSNAALLTPDDFIIAVDLDGDSAENDFLNGLDEDITNAIDGTLDLYLNFGGTNSGFIVTPSLGPTVVTSFQITTAVDVPERDPTSWSLFGTNEPIASLNDSDGGSESWSFIDAGSISLPAARDSLGPVVHVNNVVPYASYRMTFPTLKDSNTTIMHFAEIQFDGTPTPLLPEPSFVSMSSVCGLAFASARRRPRRRV